MPGKLAALFYAMGKGTDLKMTKRFHEAERFRICPFRCSLLLGINQSLQPQIAELSQLIMNSSTSSSRSSSEVTEAPLSPNSNNWRRRIGDVSISRNRMSRGNTISLFFTSSALVAAAFYCSGDYFWTLRIPSIEWALRSFGPETWKIEEER